jgi:hypothetical protein
VSEKPTRCHVITQVQACSRLLWPFVYSSPVGELMRPNERVLDRWRQANRGRHAQPEYKPTGYVNFDASLDGMATLVRQLTVPVIVDAFVRYVSEQDGGDARIGDMHRTAETLGGHWLGVLLALWLGRPRDGQRCHSQHAWRREVSRVFVGAVPAAPNEYVIQTDARFDSVAYAPDHSFLEVAGLVALESPCSSGLEVAARVDAICREVYGRACYFTLTLQNDSTWLVGVPYLDAGAFIVRRVVPWPTGRGEPRESRTVAIPSQLH